MASKTWKKRFETIRENIIVSSVTVPALAILGLVGTFVLSAFTGGWIISFLGGATQQGVEKQLADFQAKYLGTVPSPLPAGAILIVDNVNGCPKGWVDLGTKEAELFAGRTIVAVGKKKIYRDRGGFETTRLTISQLPSHSHRPLGRQKTIRVVTRGGILSGEDWITVLTPEETCRDCKERIIATSSQSTQAVIDLLPPYIALYLCKKE